MIEFRRDGYGIRVTDGTGGAIRLTALDAQDIVDGLWEEYWQSRGGPANVEWPYPHVTEETEKDREGEKE